MTRIQWRSYQRNKKEAKEASTSQRKLVEENSHVEDILPAEATKTIEFPIPEVYYPKLKKTEKEKAIANQRMAMRVAPLGNTELVAT